MGKGQPRSAHHLGFFQSLLQLVSPGQTNLVPASYRYSILISSWYVNWSGHVRLCYTAYVSLGLPGSLSQESYTPTLGAFQTSLYLWCPLTTLDTTNACTILASHVMIKQMNVAFKFSMACEWCALIKEDKDNSLQFAKVFLTKFLK